MKRVQTWIRVILTLGMVLSLAACGQSAQEAWQEQYDLGVRYLSEGNYEEASPVNFDHIGKGQCLRGLWLRLW